MFEGPMMGPNKSPKEDAMFQFTKSRFAAFSLAAAASLALISSASALTPQQLGNQKIQQTPAQTIQNLQNLQNKPNGKIYFNPNLKLAQPYKPVPPIVTPNPHFYPKVKPYYFPKYYPVVQPVQTIVEPVYLTKTVKQVVTAAAPAKSSCLTKEITAEGLVIFRDTCTNEVATTAVPGTPAAAAMEAQQAALAQMSAPQVASSQVAPASPAPATPAEPSKF